MDKYLLASTCVLMASKFFEQDENLIQIADIQTHLKKTKKLKYDDVTSTEINALTLLDWSLFRVIPLDYLQIFLQIGSIFDFDITNKSQSPS